MSTCVRSRASVCTSRLDAREGARIAREQPQASKPMSTSALTRLGAFAAILAVVFVAALFVGRAVGPLGDEGEPPSRPPGSSVPTATTTTQHAH